MRFPHGFVQIHRVVGRQGKELVEAQNHLPPHKLLVHHVDVVSQVSRTGHVRTELHHEVCAAYLVNLPPFAKLFGYGENVYGRAGGVHVLQCLEHLLVFGVVEHLCTEFVTDHRHSRGFNEACA